jgi:hypothetical protein
MLRAIVGVLLLIVCACAPASPPELNIGNVKPAPARINADLASLDVEPASRDRAVDPLPPSLLPLLPPWRDALQDALSRTALFTPGAPRRMFLKVKVLQFAVSGGALNLFARYQLFDNPAGDPIFSTDVMTNIPIASGEDAASALRDQRLARRAIQANIVQFLDRLETLAQQQRTGALPVFVVSLANGTAPGADPGTLRSLRPRRLLAGFGQAEIGLKQSAQKTGSKGAQRIDGDLRIASRPGNPVIRREQALAFAAEQ